jgi:hypothetical protein
MRSLFLVVALKESGVGVNDDVHDVGCGWKRGGRAGDGDVRRRFLELEG